ncbi:hypothetical protein C7410_122110 [Paraburkholderia silvatlantica]|uniref:VOC domain-containing protein n=1 Tax=Paraburkholderia silvatlantica TaxID=321895 RepID=A0A2V4T3V4_9BURK|nr:VOC family protein [Paraburkholderia silvatlantica]PYE18408.1 hypothetical protein C7410_122110 [Paraburkholderia silvatlantica]
MRIVSHVFRRCVARDSFDATIAFYEELQTTACLRRFIAVEAGVEVAVVGRFVLLTGDDGALDSLREVESILTVDSLDGAGAWLEELGAQVVKPLHRSAGGGRNLVARHPDGLVVEYYESSSTTPSVGNRAGDA